MPGGEHVRQREQREHGLVAVAAAGHRHKGPVGERHAYGLALAAVSVLREEAAVGARRRDAVAAVRAGPVAEGERRDDEIALLDVLDAGPDVLDDAGELVADRPALERRVAAVVPEVRSADAGQDDAHDRIGWLGDHGIAAFLDGDRVGFVEDGSTHVL